MPTDGEARRAERGFWLVQISGAVAYLRHEGDPDARSAARIYEVLDEFGCLEGRDRTRASVLKTIRARLGNPRYRGLIPD